MLILSRLLVLLDILCCPPYPAIRNIFFVPNVTALNKKGYGLAKKEEKMTVVFDFPVMIYTIYANNIT